MKMLKNPGKVDLVINMFPEIGDAHDLDDVLAVTGIPNYDALKSALFYIRKRANAPDENRVDIRIKEGRCYRVN